MKLSCKKLSPSLAENLKDTSGKRRKRQFSFTQGIGWVWGLSRASEGSKTRQPVHTETRATQEQNKPSGNHSICKGL